MIPAVGVADSVSAKKYAESDADFFVCAKGDDAWSGKLADPSGKSDGPFATLERAKTAVRDLRKRSPDKPILVLLRGGEYLLRRTVVFGPEDSGTAKAPIVYAAYPGEKPVFSSGQPITKWTKTEAFPDTLPDVAKGHVWTARVDLREVFSLYNGTKRLPRASSSERAGSQAKGASGLNRPPKKIGRSLRLLREKGETGPIVFGRKMAYRGNDFEQWSNLQDVEVVVCPNWRWVLNILPIESLDTEAQEVMFTVPATYAFKPNNRYTIENALPLLDEPGGWVWHGKEQQIYLWPDGPLKEADIRVPVLREFIRVEGLEKGKKTCFLTFDGLEFRHNLREVWRQDDQGLQHDWERYDKGNAFLRFRHAEDCVVQNCRLTSGCGGGIRLDMHCQRIKILSNVLADLGGTGILLSGYAPGTVDVNKQNVVHNNWIHHVGQVFSHAPAIFVTQSGHNTITHNTIHDLPYDGIVVSGCRVLFVALHPQLANRRELGNSVRIDEIRKGLGNKPLERIEQLAPFLHARENLVARNEIFRTMLTLDNGNPIYLSGTGVNNGVEENFLHDTFHDKGSIRLDDDAAFTYIVKNVMLREGLGLNTKAECVARNNFVIDPKLMFRKFKARATADKYVFMFTEDTDNGPYFLEGGSSPFWKPYAEISNSIYYGKKLPDRELLNHDLLTGRPVVPGKDKVNILFADPGLDPSGMKERRFIFKPDSPAVKLGIEPIDLGDVGSSLAKERRRGTDERDAR